MKQKAINKIISLISAFAVLISALGVGSSAFADTNNTYEFNLQSVVDEADLNFTNETTEGEFDEALKGLTLPLGYEVKSISDFYLLKAIEGAVEKGSTYEGAPEEEILVEGVDGAVGAVVELTTPNGTEKTVVTGVIEPTMAVYSFASVSTEEDFVFNSQSWANRWEYTPKNGTAAEKIVIPNKITELKPDWNQYWNYGVKDTVRCVVFNENLVEIPGVTGGAWNALEVVAFKGNKLKAINSYTSSGGTIYGAFHNAVNLKHIRLPESVTILSDFTFWNCKSLVGLYLPDGLTTIGNYIFHDGWFERGSQGEHILPELTVPSSVQSIGQCAFAGATEPFVATVLTTSSNINTRAFGTWYDQGAYNCNVTLRAFSGTSAANPYFNNTTTESKFAAIEMLDEVMGLAEATIRLKQKAEKVAKINYTSDEDVLSALRTAFVVDTIELSLKGDWETNGAYMKNTAVLSKDGIVSEVPIKITQNGSYDLQSIVDNASITVTNDTTDYDLLAQLKELSLDGCEVTEITEFYKIKAIEGAIEKGSTYKDAVDGEVLVPGEKGYVSAVVVLSDGDMEYSSAITLTIQPSMAEYSFASVSDTTADPNVNIDWSWDSYNKKWSYTPASGTAAEKLVIPEGITELKSDWSQWWENDYSVRKKVRCVVFNEYLTSLPGVTGGNCWSALEVVAFKGNSLKTLGSFTSSGGDTYGAFYNAYNLKHIRLPDSVTTIGSGTFIKCMSLTTLYMPESLKTIENWVFFNGNADYTGQGHNLTEITIPATVETVGQNAFAGSLSSFTATVLTSSDGVNNRAFSTWWDNGKYNPNTTVRALSGTAAANPFFNGGTEGRYKALLYLESDMGVAEAAARAKQRADKINGITVDGIDELKAILTEAYGGVTSITADWENSNWKQNGELWVNNLTLTKNGKRATVKVCVGIEPKDVQSVLDACDLSAKLTKNITEDDFKALLDEELPDGYKVKTIKEFFRVNPIGGAVDTAENEVLVEGHNGSVAAIVEVIGFDGKITTATIVNSIPAEMNKLTFNSVSEPSDFEIDGGILKKYSGTAEKVIIPEGVITLASDWLSGIESKKENYDAADNTIRCIVYPASLEGTIPAQKQLEALEVISFKGDNVTELGEYAFLKAKSLKYVDLPAGLKTISKGALATGPDSANVELSEIYLPEGLVTIGDNAFSWNNETWTDRTRNGLIEAVIPQSVTTIGKNAFSYSLKSPTFTVTLLNDETVCDSSFGYDRNGAKVIIRASKNSDAYKEYNNHSSGRYTVVALEDMTLTEAAARARAKTDELNKVCYDSDITVDEISKQLIKAFGSSDRFSYGFGNTWDDSIDGKRSGTFTLTKDDISFSMAVSLNVEPVYNLADLIEAAKSAVDSNEFTNSVDSNVFKSMLNEDMPGGYKVEISEFTIRKAIDGAKDKSGVLVSGYNGSIVAIVKVTDYFGNSSEIAVETEVVPVLKSYTFNSVSKKEDFLISEDGKTLIEYYGKAEKIIIPEGVETITEGWMWGNPTVVKALVLPKSLKALPKELCDGMFALEVVSMHDNVVNVGESTFENCYSLRYVHLSENIEGISAFMFAFNYSLFGLHIPDSVTYIGESAFIRSSLRDITVSENIEEVGNWAISFFLKDSKQLGTDSFAVEDSVKSNISDWIDENSYADGEAVPVTVTVLGTATKVLNTNFLNGDQRFAKIYIRAPKNSEAYTVAEYRIENNTNVSPAEVLWQLEELDMSFTEAVARANVAADALVLFNGASADTVKNFIESTYISSKTSNSISWRKTLEIKNASEKANGSATGILQLIDTTGNFKLDVNIDSTVFAKRPEGYTGGDSGDIWGDDWDDEFLDDFDDFDDDWDSDFDDEDEDLEDFENPKENKPTSNKKPASNKNEKTHFPWIWIILSGSVVVLLAGGILTFIIIRKKRDSK